MIEKKSRNEKNQFGTSFRKDNIQNEGYILLQPHDAKYLLFDQCTIQMDIPSVYMDQLTGSMARSLG